MPAAYFSNFPFHRYSLNPQTAPGEYEWVTDIFHRAAPIKNILQNREAYYTYQVIEGESPEIVADKEYGSPKYFWVITLLNNIRDPLLDWPKNYGDLVAYVTDKYGSLALASSTIHHYTMTITKTDSLGNASEETTVIDQTKYDSLVSLVPEVFTFSDGNTVTKTISRSSVDCYTYEIDLNEQKRSIKLLKDTFIPQVVAELETLLNTQE